MNEEWLPIRFQNGYQSDFKMAANQIPKWPTAEKQVLPECGHRDDGVPERFWNACEAGFRHVLFSVEHDGGEDDDGHGEGEEEEAELLGAALEGVSEDAQSLRVSGELEDAEHAKHAKGYECPAQVLVVGDAQPDVVG